LLQNDRAFAAEVLAINGSAMKYLSAFGRVGDRAVPYGRDHEMITIAIQSNGWAIQWLPDDILNDRRLILMAVRQNGACISCAPENMKSDREVALEAVRSNAASFRWIDKTLQDDEELLRIATEQGYPEAFNWGTAASSGVRSRFGRSGVSRFAAATADDAK